MFQASSHDEMTTLLRELHRICCSVDCFGATSWVRVDDASQFRKALVNQLDLFEDMTIRYRVTTQTNEMHNEHPSKREYAISADDVGKLDRLVFKQSPHPTVRVEFPVQIRVNIPTHERLQENCWISSFDDLQRRMNEMTNYRFNFNVIFCGEQVFAEDFKDWVTGLAGEDYTAEFGNPTSKQQYAGGSINPMVSSMPSTSWAHQSTAGGPVNLTHTNTYSSQKTGRPAMTNLFVEGLPSDWTATQLYDYFKEFGMVTACRVLGKRFPGAAIQSGLVDFESYEQACRAIDGAQRMKRSSGSPRFEIRFANNHRQQSYVPIFNRNLYVTNIPLTWNEGDLRALFSRFPGVVSTCVRMPGVGFVNFDSQDNAKAAMDSMQNTVPHGCSLPIAIAFARNGKDRVRKRCEFFQRGACSYGDNCRNVHEEEEEQQDERQTVCKYYLTGCRFGQNCRNKHVGDMFNDIDSEEKSDRYSNRGGESASNSSVAPPTWSRRDSDVEAGFKNYFRFFF